MVDWEPMVLLIYFGVIGLAILIMAINANLKDRLERIEKIVRYGPDESKWPKRGDPKKQT